MNVLLIHAITVKVAEPRKSNNLNFKISLDEDKSKSSNTEDLKKDQIHPNPKTDNESSVSNEFQVVRPKENSSFSKKLFLNVKSNIKSFGNSIKESISEYATGIEIEPYLDLLYKKPEFTNKKLRLKSIFYNYQKIPLKSKDICTYDIKGIFNVYLPNQIFGPYFVEEFKNSHIFDPFADGCCGYYAILLHAYTNIQRLGKYLPVISTATQNLVDMIKHSKNLLKKHKCFTEYSYNDALDLVAFFKYLLYFFICQNIDKYYNIKGLLPENQLYSDLSDAEKRCYIKGQFFRNIGNPLSWLDGNKLPLIADVLEAEIIVWNLNNYNDILEINSMSFKSNNPNLKFEILSIRRADHFLAIRRHNLQ
ncbi:hypothetical protein NUSPORA_02437 [Nucleospora cyclopteri]